MTIWIGLTWKCVCGWHNATLRRTCRNCRRQRDSNCIYLGPRTVIGIVREVERVRQEGPK